MFCPECGKENKEDSKFCQNCGTALGEPSKTIKQPRKSNIIRLIFFIVFISLTSIASYWFLFRETAKDYFPPEGASLVFEVITTTEATTKTVESHRFIGKKTEFQGKSATPISFKIIAVGKRPIEATQFYEINPDVIKYIGDQSLEKDRIRVYAPPRVVFKLPLKKGLTWEERTVQKTIIKGEEEQEAVTFKYTILGKEIVEVPAGKFNCWKVERMIIEEDGKINSKSTMWYAKKFGIVKSIDEGSYGEKTEMVLKTYKFK